MLIWLVISIAITIFLLVATLFVLLSGPCRLEARLLEVAAGAPEGSTTAAAPILTDAQTTPLGRAAAGFTSYLNPLRGLITGTDTDLARKLTLAGFRKPQHVEIFTATKLAMPVVGLVVASFFGSNLFAAILVGLVAGFFLPDMVLSYLVSRRQENIRIALPDALDLLVICMEAGLAIDQAMARVGEELSMTAPELSEEFQIMNREMRAGKPRLDAWRSLSDRIDLDTLRQFVTMLVQTERFGAPVANALSVFADSMRTRRVQAAEESAAKAGVKLLFPLILFIFPSIFVVTLGPAILNIQKMFEELFR